MESIETEGKDKPTLICFNKDYVISNHIQQGIIIARTHSYDWKTCSIEIIQRMSSRAATAHKRLGWIWEAVNGLEKKDCLFNTEQEAEQWLEKFAKDNGWINWSYHV